MVTYYTMLIVSELNHRIVGRIELPDFLDDAGQYFQCSIDICLGGLFTHA